jgi:hypothetical protein
MVAVSGRWKRGLARGKLLNVWAKDKVVRQVEMQRIRNLRIYKDK